MIGLCDFMTEFCEFRAALIVYACSISAIGSNKTFHTPCPAPITHAYVHVLLSHILTHLFKLHPHCHFSRLTQQAKPGFQSINQSINRFTTQQGRSQVEVFLVGLLCCNMWAVAMVIQLWLVLKAITAYNTEYNTIQYNTETSRQSSGLVYFIVVDFVYSRPRVLNCRKSC